MPTTLSMVALSNVLACSIVIFLETKLSLAHEHYQLNLIPNGGAEIKGLNLSDAVLPGAIRQIKKDLNTHGLLVFRDQGNVSGDRQVEITQWFGELYSFPQSHKQAPRSDIIRLSNDESEGFDKLATPTFMIDGPHLPKPFGYAVWHVVAPPKVIDTGFLNLYHAVGKLDLERLEELERIWIETNPGPPPKEATVYPLIYKHPASKRKTILLASPMLSTFHYDYDSPKHRRRLKPGQTREVGLELIRLCRNMSDAAYNHTWAKGDVVIVDNLAVGTWIMKESQMTKDEIGLRILHKSMAEGSRVPKKGYRVDRDKPIKREGRQTEEDDHYEKLIKSRSRSRSRDRPSRSSRDRFSYQKVTKKVPVDESRPRGSTVNSNTRPNVRPRKTARSFRDEL